MSKKANVVIAVLAVALFAWAISRMDASAVARQRKAITSVLPIVLGLSVLRLFLQSLSWSLALQGEGLSVPKARLAALRLGSQSVGYLTVLGPIASEPLKIKLLGASPERTIRATFLDNGVYWFTTALVAICGVLCLPLIGLRPSRVHAIVALAVLGAIVHIITRRRPILSPLLRALGARAPQWLVRAEKLEASIRTSRFAQPKLVSHMFWIDVACQMLTAMEVVVVLWTLHLPIHFLGVVAIEGVTRAAKMAGGWLPARLGADEGAAISAFAMAGFSPALGLSLALSRRVRDLLWALIGIVWLTLSSRSMPEPHTSELPVLGLKEAY